MADVPPPQFDGQIGRFEHHAVLVPRFEQFVQRHDAELGGLQYVANQLGLCVLVPSWGLLPHSFRLFECGQTTLGGLEPLLCHSQALLDVTRTSLSGRERLPGLAVFARFIHGFPGILDVRDLVCQRGPRWQWREPPGIRRDAGRAARLAPWKRFERRRR